MSESIYVYGVATFLLLSALCHFFWPSETQRWMSKPGVVRTAGGFLLLLAVPCLYWRGWYFGTLFGALIISVFRGTPSAHKSEATHGGYMAVCCWEAH
jgi:hypothetical protein